MIGALLGVSAMLLLPKLATHVHSESRYGLAGSGAAHTSRAFEFVAKAPIGAVAPLLGANRERAWAPGWNPKFVWPAKARDRLGMVFTIAHGSQDAIWVNTRFDLNEGDVQYVYVVPKVMVTVITIKLRGDGASTRVAVVYDRTALDVKANGLMQEMADRDAGSGPEWASQVNGYLGH
jgi:hypothetical protein